VQTWAKPRADSNADALFHLSYGGSARPWISPAGRGDSLSFADQKCSCVIPDDWTQKGTHGDLVNAVNPETDKSFVLDTKPGATMAMDDPALPKALEAGITSQDGTILNSQHITMANADFFVIDCQIKLKNLSNPIGFSRFYFTMANNSLYSLAITSRLPNPQDDLELTGIVNSFAFIGIIYFIVRRFRRPKPPQV
jgi:hypothetical protein